MESPNPDRDPDTTIFHFVDALTNMHDALAKASLMLQDYQFDFDSVRRGAATEHAKELIEKVKSR